VRNYEHDGVLPPAQRTTNGYRRFTDAHARALNAYLALVAGHGYAASGDIMRAVNRGDLDAALRVIDRGHALLQRDRETLDAVETAVSAATAPALPETGAPPRPPSGTAVTVGTLAHRLDVRPATLRTWERTGILRPARDPATGYRVYSPADVRDAELAHLLRRGGYRLCYIAGVLDRVRDAGGTEPLTESLRQWRERLTERGVAMLTAAARLAEYLHTGAGLEA
jgi:DNA-binding transcriptional MerR regulator